MQITNLHSAGLLLIGSEYMDVLFQDAQLIGLGNVGLHGDGHGGGYGLAISASGSDSDMYCAGESLWECDKTAVADSHLFLVGNIADVAAHIGRLDLISACARVRGSQCHVLLPDGQDIVFYDREVQRSASLIIPDTGVLYQSLAGVYILGVNDRVICVLHKSPAPVNDGQFRGLLSSVIVKQGLRQGSFAVGDGNDVAAVHPCSVRFQAKKAYIGLQSKGIPRFAAPFTVISRICPVRIPGKCRDIIRKRDFPEIGTIGKRSFIELDKKSVYPGKIQLRQTLVVSECTRCNRQQSGGKNDLFKSTASKRFPVNRPYAVRQDACAVNGVCYGHTYRTQAAAVAESVGRDAGDRRG